MPTIKLKLPPTKKVLYSKKPLTGKDDVIEEIAAEKFAEEHGFQWTDDLLVEDTLAANLQLNEIGLERLATRYLIASARGANTSFKESVNSIDKNTVHNVIEQQDKQAKIYLAQIKKNSHGLVVCEINEQTGKGLYWRGPEILKKGEAIVAYPGIMKQRSNENFTGYEYSVPPHPIFEGFSSTSKGIIDGQTGGLGRFAQSFPTKDNLLKHYRLDSSVPVETIATENIEAENIYYKGWPLVVLVATEDIKPNTPLGFDYTLSYWGRFHAFHSTNPLLFTKKDGQILHPSLYERLFFFIDLKDQHEGIPITFKQLYECITYNLPFTGLNYNDKKSFTYSRLELINLAIADLKEPKELASIQSHLLKWLELNLSKAPILNEDYNSQFIHTVHTLLLKYWLEYSLNASPNTTDQIILIDKLLTTIETEKTATDLFNKIRTIMLYSEDKNLFLKHLPTMRKGIVNVLKDHYTKAQNAPAAAKVSHTIKTEEAPIAQSTSTSPS